MNRSLRALDAVNFFSADVTAGLGPFLGVYLQERHWSPADIGMVMTIGGIAGVVVTGPLGALVDRTRAKRAVVAFAAAVIALASLPLLFVFDFAATAGSQVLTSIAGAAIGSTLAALALGLVGQAGFAHTMGRNQAFNHAGNVVAALLAGGLGYVFGMTAVFGVLAAMTMLSMFAVARIDPKSIDHRAARGAGASGGGTSGWSVLFTCTPLVVLAAALTLFHLGNAAMLPLLGQALMAHGVGHPSTYTGVTIVIAQLTMVPMAVLAARLAETRGYWGVFLLALLALPLRGAVAAYVNGPLGLLPVQVLDGVGAGLLSVAVPGLVARILNGTGHVNAGLGAVMTMQGVGASLSPALGGVIAGRFGYDMAFIGLGAVAALALLLWVLARPFTAEACTSRGDATSPA
jgi:MFS family permease